MTGSDWVPSESLPPLPLLPTQRSHGVPVLQSAEVAAELERHAGGGLFSGGGTL